MTALEVRCRWLLLAYPAAYRRVRAEEILGTLLETTPAGRTWPLARDCWALILGGLQARAAQNRRLSTRTNLRLATLLGCVIYLCFAAYSLLGMNLWYGDFGQPAFAVGVLLAMVLLLARPTGRGITSAGKAVAIAAVIAGTTVAVVAMPKNVITLLLIPEVLLVLAALALLSHGTERLPRLWLWLPGLMVAIAALAPLARALSFPQYVNLLVPSPSWYVWAAIGAAAAAWIRVDARPAVGVAAFLGLEAATRLINAWTSTLVTPPATWSARVASAWDSMLAYRMDMIWSFAWKLFAVALALAVLSAWPLRRQAML